MNSNLPSASLVAVMGNRICKLTVAPGIGALEGSVTTPRIVSYVALPVYGSVAADSKTTQAKANTSRASDPSFISY